MKQIDKYQYNPKDMLGMGSTGTVLKAIDAKKNQYALRIIKKNSITDDEGLQCALLDEIKLMQQLKHPKIVQLVQCMIRMFQKEIIKLKKLIFQIQYKPL